MLRSSALGDDGDDDRKLFLWGFDKKTAKVRTVSVEMRLTNLCLFVAMYRISRPDQVVYNDKATEVKDIIGIGPSVKNIFTVRADVSLLLSCTKSTNF